MQVRFFGGTKAQYLSLATPRNKMGLYFCYDTRELFWGDQLISDGTRVVATEAALPKLDLAADGITYFAEDTRNGYVLSSDRTKWVKVIQAPEAGSSSVKAISFAGIEMEEVDGVFTIDRRCAREALGFIVPEGMEDEELEIVTKEYVDEKIAAIPGTDIDLSEYAKQTDLEEYAKKSDMPSTEGLATEQYVIDAIAAQVPIEDLAKKEEIEEVKEKLEAEILPTIQETILPVVEKAATQEWVQEQGYLTEHQSLEGLATEEFVIQKIVEAELADKDIDLSAYYTKSETELAIKAAIDAIEVPDVSSLATKEELEAVQNVAGSNSVKLFAIESDLVDISQQLENIPITYATKEEVAAVEAKIDAIVIPEVPTRVSELENDAGYITAKDIPESELFVVNYNAPDFAAALEAYKNGKLLLLTNAAPDANGYAVMNYVRDDLITFTKFLMSRKGTHGSFNTYYLHNDNTWEIAKEVKLNKVDAIVDGNNDITGLTIGQDTYEFDNFATAETINQINQNIENIQNTYVTNEILEQKNYITVQDANDTYVTTEQVTEVVTNEVQTVVTEQIETKVTEVIEKKIEDGNLDVKADSISYDTW